MPQKRTPYDPSQNAPPSRPITKAEEAAGTLQGTLQKLERVNVEMAEASRMKSEFLANTSHELRTPLTSIIGYLNLVLDGLADNPEEAMDFVRTARDSSKHLLRLINDVLDLAKIEAGKLTIHIEDLSLNAVLGETQAIAQVQAMQKNIALQFAPAECDMTVRADRARVKQVLLNLIGNAVKFTENGSVEVSLYRTEDSAGVRIKDTGIGVSRSVQERLFQPFVQADGSTTRRFGGTGLGLAITRALVEKMGGQIRLQSAGEGHGTTVEFTLPLADAGVTPRPESREKTDRRRAAGHKIRLLIADDDPSVTRLIVRLLPKNAYEIDVVNNGGEALDYLIGRPAVEVLILDLRMPGMSGYDVLSILKEKYGAPLPVVIVTNYADSVSPEQRQLLESPFVKAIIPKTQIYERLPAHLSELFGINHPEEVA